MSKEERLEWEALNDKAEKKKELKFFFLAVCMLLFSFIYVLYGNILIEKHNWHGTIIVFAYIFISGFGVILGLIGLYRLVSVIFGIIIRASLKKVSVSAVRSQGVLLFSLYFFLIGERLVDVISRNSESINTYLYSNPSLISTLGLYFLMFLVSIYFLILRGLIRSLPKSLARFHLLLTRKQHIINLIFCVLFFPILYLAICKLYVFNAVSFFGLELSGANGKFWLLSTIVFYLLSLNFLIFSVVIIIQSTIFNHSNKLIMNKLHVMFYSVFYMFLSFAFYLTGHYSNLLISEKFEKGSKFFFNGYGQIYFPIELICMSLTLLAFVMFWHSVRSMFLDITQISIEKI